MSINIFSNKRGMSPLLVTIFLVAFAVALGAMIMSWGSNNERPDSSTCNDVSITPQMFSGSEMICYNDTTGMLKVVITNSGTLPIHAITNRQISSDFSIEDDVISNSAMRSGGVLSINLALKPGRVRVELIPSINVNNDIVLCGGKSLIREEIKMC